MTIKKKSRGSQEKDVIVGLDVGTTKICVIVARVKDDNNIDILGTAQRNSCESEQDYRINQRSD